VYPEFQGIYVGSPDDYEVIEMDDDERELL